MTQWYYFYQTVEEGNDRPWILDLASNRKATVSKIKPAFTTILDVDTTFEEEVLPEDKFKAHYRGPFYIDLDCEDPQEVLDQFKKLLNKLVNDYDVDLHQLRLYLTGGRGFHITFDPVMFVSAVPARGTPMLPMIYKEMAHGLYVDTLDLAIYSTKRGRMFREPNVKRANGRFKVPITPEEAMEMTVEQYQRLSAEPRHIPEPRPAEYHPKLALLYSKVEQKVNNAIKQLKTRKTDNKLLEKFRDTVPPTLTAVMSGERLSEDKGFQEIAMQLAIIACGAGWELEFFLSQCEGLINNHQSNGHRYNTPAKRTAELRRMWNYMNNNPMYSFSVGGLKSIMVKGSDTTDIETGGVSAPPEGGEESQPAPTDSLSFAISQGIRITEHGIFRKTEDGLQQVCALGLANPKQLLVLETREVHGYEVDVFVEGKATKPKIITMDAFSSRQAFMKFTLSAGSCAVNLPDSQIGAIADIMRHRTEKSGQQVYTVQREGIDVISTPGGEVDMIWADQSGVVSRQGKNYRLTGSMTGEPQFRGDLRYAPALVDNEYTREFFDRLFNINTLDVVGRYMGFFVACFLCQPIRHLFGQFPIMQVYGQAGSGKSQMTRLFTQLHYYRIPPVINSALDSTRFTLEEMATCSGSMPFVLDEFKPREMRRDILEKAKGILRSNYNGDAVSKGSIRTSTGEAKMTVTRMLNRSPVCVVAEAMITQTAILERSIVVPMSKEGKVGHRDDFLWCQEHKEVLSMLGRCCMDAALGLEFDELRRFVSTYHNKVREKVGGKADDNERPTFNVAVNLTGLEFVRRVMETVFGDTYNTTFTAMRDAVAVTTDNLIPKVMSEAAKVLNEMAVMSRYSDDERLKLYYVEDYLIDGPTVHLRLRNCYNKYAKFKRNMGDEILYDSFDAFYSAMTSYRGVVDTTCAASPLKDSPNTAVFSFSLAKLAEDGVEEFFSSAK